MSATFFTFQQGSDTRSLPPSDAESVRYGRFRAFSTKRSFQNLFSAFTGDGSDESDSSYAGYTSYGSISFARGAEVTGDDEDNDEEDERWWGDRIFLSPSRSKVRFMMGKWWRRWAYLIILPAAIVSFDPATPASFLLIGGRIVGPMVCRSVSYIPAGVGKRLRCRIQ